MPDNEMSWNDPISRRRLIGRGVGLSGALAAAPLIAACGGGNKATTSAGRAAAGATGAFKGTGTVKIGAFADGGLTAFKERIVPLFKQQTGISIDYLEDDYNTFFEKAFQDGQRKAGQYDIYVMDDVWVAQYIAGGALQNLSKLGMKLDSDYVENLLGMAYWPPKKGPRVKEVENATPALYAVPFVGDVQIFNYRKDIFGTRPKTWDELVKVAKAKADPSKQRYGYVFRGVAGNPIVTSWFTIHYAFGSSIFDDNWEPVFNDSKGKAALEFMVSTLKSLAPPGVVEYDQDQEGAALLSGKAFAAVQYSAGSIKVDDPKQSKVAGKIDFGPPPAKERSAAQIGIFISGLSAGAPNRENALKFLRWFQQTPIQTEMARAGGLPVKRASFEDAQAQKVRRLLPAALASIDSGTPRPFMPDWAKVESIIGVELNKALQRGSAGDSLDRAASQVRKYLQRQGYYA